MLTQQEVLDRYGKVQLKFNYYHKYTFSFYGFAPDGTKISHSYGGTYENIYRYTVDVRNPIYLENVMGVGTVRITKHGKLVYENDSRYATA